MRVVTVKTLIDRIHEALDDVHVRGLEVSHIELTERELQQVSHEVVGDPNAFKSDCMTQTRLFGHRVVLV